MVLQSRTMMLGWLREDDTVDKQPSCAGQVDKWDSGIAYEPYVGRWSRLVAHEFVLGLAVPPESRWLDVGSGTGALSQAILAHASPREVVGIETSASYVAFAQERVNNERARFEVGDAQALRAGTATYDAVVAGLVLNFVPQPSRAVAEMSRVVRPGGTVAAYVWDYAEGMQMIRYFWDAAAALDPRARKLDEGQRFPLCRPEPFTELLRTAGLRDVEVHTIEVPSDFRDFDDYWSPFLGGQGPAPSYAMSLSEDRRDVLRERIRASLPTNSDGGIHLVSRAWAVRGIG